MSNEQNKPKFTPGPWALAGQRPAVLSGYGSEFLYEVVSTDKCPLNEGESWQVAVVYGSDVEDDQCESDRIVRELGLANAHLIAAAPDMYDALKSARACLSAEYGNDEPDDTPDDLCKNHDTYRKIVAALAKARGENA